jgi:hypothetical protein
MGGIHPQQEIGCNPHDKMELRQSEKSNCSGSPMDFQTLQKSMYPGNWLFSFCLSLPKFYRREFTKMATTAIQKTYEETEALIHKTMWNFKNRKKVPDNHLEDLRAQAGLSYCKAYRSYDPTKGAFSTWLVCSIWFDFLTEMRRIGIERDRFPIVQVPDSDHVAREHFDLQKFMLDLSNDARDVVRLILDGPDEIRKVISRKGGGSNQKAAVIEYVTKSLDGWTVTRAAKTFDEIRSALS